ncbi:MAG: transcription antitermination factor NusB [Proteobacteria bacterium]|nr:transcription antitermination factor NusB [Pseudomonadota bacterium]
MSKRDRFGPRKRARRRALQAIYQWQITDQDATEILHQFREMQDLSQVDEAYFERLLRSVIKHKERLIDALEPFLDRPMDQVDVMERVVLMIGAWELLDCPDLPYRVVLDESVDLARRFGSEQGHSYVNAVLDKAARKWRADEIATTPRH